jgi:hypothetical protein
MRLKMTLDNYAAHMTLKNLEGQTQNKSLVFLWEAILPCCFVTMSLYPDVASEIAMVRI